MKANVEKIKRMQAAIRTEAMKGSVEEALNALAAVAGEAILTVEGGSRDKLLQIFTAMTMDAIRRGVAPGGKLQ